MTNIIENSEKNMFGSIKSPEKGRKSCIYSKILDFFYINNEMQPYIFIKFFQNFPEFSSKCFTILQEFFHKISLIFHHFFKQINDENVSKK